MWAQKARTSKKEWKWQRGIVTHPLSKPVEQGPLWYEKVGVREAQKLVYIPAEGFKGHVATGGFLLGTAGKWGACGWVVVQLDYDDELGLVHGMYGSMEAEFEVQRTVKRVELAAFLCLLKKVIGTIKVHVDNKGIIDGLLRGERRCIDPKAGDADLWIKIWEELHSLAARDIVVEVEHVEAHRTKNGKKFLSHVEKFVTEGNEKADELAKAGAMLDE